MIDIAIDIASGVGGLALKIFLIVVPLLMFLEWARTRRWFSRLVELTGVVFAPIGFRKPAIFPLLTGLLFGISYGAGVLIPQARSGDIDPKQVFLVTTYLGICHALFEDTLLFVAVGAKGWILVITRLVAATCIVFVFSKMSWPRPDPELELELELEQTQ